MSNFLEKSRLGRKEAVKASIEASFFGWPRLTRRATQIYDTQFLKPGYELNQNEAQAAIDEFCHGREVQDWSKLSPRYFNKGLWTQLLPNMLLCNECEDSIGVHPIVLGLPPMPAGEWSPLVESELISILSDDHIKSLQLYCEMFHWLIKRQSDYSHYYAFWSKAS